MTDDDMAGALAELAVLAGREILAIYSEWDVSRGIAGAEPMRVRLKADSSPVTEADLRAEAVILEGLSALAPNIPVVAEESVANGVVPSELGVEFFLVDPLDGTKEFISRNGEFTVNIALIREGVPVMGVVHTPAIGATYFGGPDGATLTVGGETRTIRVAEPPADGLRVLVSRSHLDEDTEAWLSAVRIKERVQAGSSMKFCRVADGSADVYPRFGRTMWWDTAAGHAVLAAADGRVETPDGAPFRYEGTNFANGPFIAYGTIESIRP